MSYTIIDQALKNEAVTSRIRVAILRWSFNTLSDQQAPTDERSLAKIVLRGDRRLADVLIRAIMVNPNVNPAILTDNPTGDTAIDAAVDALIPAALSVGVVSVIDPDDES